MIAKTVLKNITKDCLNVKQLQDLRCFSTLKMKLDKNATMIKQIEDHDAAASAADQLIHQKVIALPTDTVYGLACSANSPEAINKLYVIKGRNECKPVAICVANLNQLRRWGHAEHLPDELLNKLLPGPVTLVLEKTPLLSNPFLNPHTTKIGIRIPDYKFIQKVSDLSGIPVALTSANPSGTPSSLSVNEFQSLHFMLGGVFDGGHLGRGTEGERAGSTVVDLSQIGSYSVVREGVAFEKTIDLLESFNIHNNS